MAKKTSSVVFLCPHCSVREPCKNSLKSHIAKAHGLAPFLCPGCQQQFKNFRLFQKHIKESHPGILVPKEPYETTCQDSSQPGPLYTPGDPLQYLGRNQVFLADFFPLKAGFTLDQFPRQVSSEENVPGSSAQVPDYIEDVNPMDANSLTQMSEKAKDKAWYAQSQPLAYIGRNASFLVHLYPRKDLPMATERQVNIHKSYSKINLNHANSSTQKPEKAKVKAWYTPSPPLAYMGRNALFLASVYPLKDLPTIADYQIVHSESLGRKKAEVLRVEIESGEDQGATLRSPWQILTALVDILKVQVPPLAFSLKMRLQKAIQSQ